MCTYNPELTKSCVDSKCEAGRSEQWLPNDANRERLMHYDAGSPFSASRWEALGLLYGQQSQDEQGRSP
eukprot:4973929-Pyramimonas_sp.AAC.1